MAHVLFKLWQVECGGASFCAQCGNRLAATGAVNTPVSVPAAIVPVDGVYAGFWKRFAALILDYLILVVPNVLLGSYVLSILISWLYFAILESSSSQATLGKMVLGIKVVDKQGNRISFVRATGRFFGKILSGMVFCVGYIMAAFTARKQALHDLLADCLVINKTATSDQLNQPAASDSTAGVIVALVVAVAIGIPVIGILAAIALPAYQDYAIKAKMAGVMLVGQQATQAVDEYMIGYNSLPASMQDTGFSESSELVRDVTIDSNGVIRLPVNITSIEDGVLVFMQQAGHGGAWVCGGENIPEEYLPSKCRP